MKTVTARDLQKKVKECVDASQSERVVVTRRGQPAAVLVGIEGSDWEGCCSAKLPAFLETYSTEKRATHDFSAGIESPAEETQALALGHIGVLRILT